MKHQPGTTAGKFLWWRPNEASNSIGNLLLHLNGNIRQCIVAPLGGIANTRDRDAEFAERGQVDTATLRSALEQTLKECDGILSGLSTADLLETYTIQRYGGITALDAIYHVVEHFSMHCGQILYVTKLLSGMDLGFYQQLNGWGPTS
ncbi:MAG: DinB family protein [Bryobacteraceae bacterium]